MTRNCPLAGSNATRSVNVPPTSTPTSRSVCSLASKDIRSRLMNRLLSASVSVSFARATVAVSLGLIAAGCNSHSPPSVAPIDDRRTLGYLASPELQGRGVGTAGLDRAGEYIAGEFVRMGLK